MENQVRMGVNRTGAQMAPFNVEDAESFAKSRLGEGRRDGQGSAALHVDYIHEADSLGSVPIPGTAKGVATAVVSKLKGDKPSVLVDKLGERLAFERTGVRLYEALLTKWSALTEEERGADLYVDEAQLRRILEDEETHFRLLTDVLRVLGADPTAMTPAADVAGVSAAGWLQVLNDPRTTIAQALNTMLSAELTDEAGWELLIELASAAGYTEMAEGFAVAEQAERRHIERIKGWLRGSVLSEAS
jgi:bacterioferritin (cytochrome b1)